MCNLQARKIYVAESEKYIFMYSSYISYVTISEKYISLFVIYLNISYMTISEKYSCMDVVCGMRTPKPI